MSILYVDTSALLKRVVIEAESSAVTALLSQSYSAGDLLTASSFAWVEVWRALRRVGVLDVERVIEVALSGVAEHPLDEVQLHRARRAGPDNLRSLDAIHLAAAVAVGADAVVTYDRRFGEAASSVGMVVLAPS